MMSLANNNIYCFKKEEEFKELLQNLDIENIEIDLSNQNAAENNQVVQIQKNGLTLE